MASEKKHAEVTALLMAIFAPGERFEVPPFDNVVSYGCCGHTVKPGDRCPGCHQLLP